MLSRAFFVPRIVMDNGVNMQNNMIFENRREAGRALARRLMGYTGQNPVIYALPRGGAPVAAEIAQRLAAPLDLILVRKLGAPHQPELAIGAVVDGAAPTLILHDNIIRHLGVSEKYIMLAKSKALSEIERRRKIYLKGRPPISPKNKTVIIVDDGLATGATMEAAINAVRQAGPKHIIVAVPAAPVDTLSRLEKLADEMICLTTPQPFWSVGGCYRSFPQLSDDDVIACLNECANSNGQEETRSA